MVALLTTWPEDSFLEENLLGRGIFCSARNRLEDSRQPKSARGSGPSLVAKRPKSLGSNNQGINSKQPTKITNQPSAETPWPPCFRPP